MTPWRRAPALLALTVLGATLLGCSASLKLAASGPRTVAVSETESSSAIGAFVFLGEAAIAKTTALHPAPVGGLSGITYDPDRKLYYAISDDPASRGPARFYTLTINLEDGVLGPENVRVRAVTDLLDLSGAPFAEMALDGEGIALTPERTLVLSSEGHVRSGVEPFLRELRLDGTTVRELRLPKRFLPRASETRGIRHNLGFESAAVSPDGRWFFSSSENALIQDGPASDVAVASPSRILRYERYSGKIDGEYVYEVEPVAAQPPTAAAFRTRGLVDLIAYDGTSLLALEREYVEGVGNDVEIFFVSLAAATDVSGAMSLTDTSYRPARKTLALSLASLGIELDNLEGMAFGPMLDDGRRTLVLIADDNFSERQRNQVLAFALEE